MNTPARHILIYTVSAVGGAVLAWGIIAPSLVKNGLAFGKSISDDYPLISYQSLSFSDPSLYSTAPSPRYWLLWPGVLMMLVYSVSLLPPRLRPLSDHVCAS